MKRTDAQIYVIAHRPVEYEIPDNALMTPVQVGNNDRFLEHRDTDCPGSIAAMNGFFAENSGIFYAWKTHPDSLKYIGVCQYRRQFAFPEDQDFDELFKDFKVIAATPMRQYGDSMVPATTSATWNSCRRLSRTGIPSTMRTSRSG